MQNAQLKKILIITCCLLVGVGVVFIRWYIKSNIESHSVYYVRNISHDRDAHPEFAMLLDNIDSMEQPDKQKVRYKPESGASGVFSDRFYIYNGANALNDEEPILIKEDDFDGDAYVYYDNIGRRYTFDKTFKVRSAYDHENHAEIDIKTINQKALCDEIYKDFGFLIKANDKKPMINLQWLFNKKYYKRFN
ncbi:MAG: hypothetical protein HXM69_02005 [Mogibacterium diversum]|nr:hypothetical protein [Mogibacterium diversum]